MGHLIKPFLCEGIIARGHYTWGKRESFPVAPLALIITAVTFLHIRLMAANTNMHVKKALMSTVPQIVVKLAYDKSLKSSSFAFSPAISEEAFSHRQVSSRKVLEESITATVMFLLRDNHRLWSPFSSSSSQAGWLGNCFFSISSHLASQNSTLPLHFSLSTLYFPILLLFSLLPIMSPLTLLSPLSDCVRHPKKYIEWAFYTWDSHLALPNSIQQPS